MRFLVIKPTEIIMSSQATATADPTLATIDAPDTPVKAASTNGQATTPQLRPREKHSQPYFEQVLSLSTKQAHRVMERSFRALSGSLFRCEVILRIIGQEEKIDELEAYIKTTLEAAEKDIADELERAEAVCEQNGVTTPATYTLVRDFTIQIKSPLIARYARVVVQLDRLCQMLDMLWLNDLITSKERAHTTFAWQQRIVKAAWTIVRVERKARAEAHAKGHGETVEQHAPQSDHDEDLSLLREDIGNETLEETVE